MAKVRVEIISRNPYWFKAIFVEWEHQFPERQLVALSERLYEVETEWLADLQRVAQQCFGAVTIAPDDPGRRQLFRRIFWRGTSE